MRTFLLFVLPLLMPAAVRAQSIEDADVLARQAATVAKKAVAQERAGRVFPSKLVCRPAKESGLPPTLVFVTRLDAALTLESLGDKPSTVASQFAQAPGETAAALDDYRSISLSRESLDYDLWSCDTQDYSFKFSTRELARDPALKETSRPVKAHVVVETRGEVDYSGELPCDAIYQDRPAA